MTTTKDGWDLPLSEGELTRLTRDLHEAHQETLPAMRASARDLSEEIRARQQGEPRDGARETGEPREGARRTGAPRDSGRRRFLLGAGGTAVALTLAACSSGSTSSSSSSSAAGGASTASSAAAGGRYTGDLKVVALATALENQAVGAYQATLAAAKAGKLGTVPPAVAGFVTTAMAQHADHAQAWNAVLTSAGKPAITDVPLSNQPATLAALGKAANVGDVAKLALQLEDQAAQTYLFATYNVTSPAGIATAATIAPVEAMHAAILNYVLGQYPVPDDFLPVDKAASPSLLTV
ncbi:ferritin-like domain-containing protein [Kitasatospora sp. NBC_01250]|uniref:ferritin-like domain-containing protein n=1 Tax=Kitasatospora sp. NBC_01250 TaxID=2903571 RepID=UPI002E328F21|nr:ferritin-like domain-containing protein [Kitasatospora sp. NBC_01250]